MSSLQVSMSNSYHDYINLIKDLAESYELSVDFEHENIHEFFSDDEPLFKLIFNRKPDGKTFILISFHLDLPVLDGIQWYTRAMSYNEYLFLTDSYFKDDKGETVLGQEAEAIRRYKLEQEILANWQGDEEDIEEFIKSEIKVQRTASGYNTVEEAMESLALIKKDEGENVH